MLEVLILALLARLIFLYEVADLFNLLRCVLDQKLVFTLSSTELRRQTRVRQLQLCDSRSQLLDNSVSLQVLGSGETDCCSVLLVLSYLGAGTLPLFTLYGLQGQV